MEVNRQLPSQFERQVLEMPEYSYGVVRITVTLRCGKEIRDVLVAWGTEIVRVGGLDQLPFDPSDIVAVKHQ